MSGDQIRGARVGLAAPSWCRNERQRTFAAIGLVARLAGVEYSVLWIWKSRRYCRAAWRLSTDRCSSGRSMRQIAAWPTNSLRFLKNADGSSTPA